MTAVIPTKVIQEITGNLVLITLEVHIWSGRQRLEKEDLIRANPAFRQLPERELASLGSVKLCDPEDLKQFHTIKGKAERALKRRGLRLAGARAVPADEHQAAVDELVPLQVEFTTLANNFVAAFEQRVSDWKMKHTLANPAWANLFSSVPTAMHVAGRLSFDFHEVKASAPADASKPHLNERFENQVRGLKGELLDEVAEEADTLINDCLMAQRNDGSTQQREYVTQKTLGPLKRAAAKLNSFRFIDSLIGPLADLIDEVLRSLPPSGRIDGVGLMKLWSLARMLSDPKQAVDVAELAQAGSSASDLLGIVEPSSSKVAAGTSSGSDLALALDVPTVLDEVIAKPTQPSAGPDLSLLL